MQTILRREFLMGGLAAAALPGVARAADRSAIVHDLMPDFWRVYDRYRKHDMDARVTALGKHFLLPHADSYDALGFGLNRKRGRLVDSRVAFWLTELDLVEARVRLLSQQAPANWAAREPHFLDAFPAQRAGAPVWFLPGMGTFNGFGRVWANTPTLWFAPDGIVMLQSTTANLPVLFDHEAFHLYFMQVGPDSAMLLWYRMWGEGLATYVSAKLNPRASLTDLLMTTSLAEATPAQLRDAAKEALGLLDSTDSGVHYRFFDAGYSGARPARMAYYLGHRAIQLAAGDASLDTLARLRLGPARVMLKAGLEKIAAG